MGHTVSAASELVARCIAAPDQSSIDLVNLGARWDTHLVSHLTDGDSDEDVTLGTR